MPKLRVLANLELSIELPEGTDTEETIRRKERKLLRILRQLAQEESGKGELESLELESFTYATAFEAEPSGYYYNKHDRRVGPSSS
jgi:hypothetical protein